MFDKNLLSKEVWGNPTWFVIHFSSMHSPIPFNFDWALSYKAFISCLMFMIPCPKCRAHLMENLPKNHIDDYLYSRDSIFEWSVRLHNIVNESIDKPILSLLEARQLYNPGENSFEKIRF